LPINPASDIASPPTHASVKFNLALPKALPYVGQNPGDDDSHLSFFSHQGPRLPSSLSVGSVVPLPPSGYVQRNDIKVTYTMQAHAIRKGEVIGSISKEIRIFDGTDPQPPICTRDFSSEYLCQQKRALRRIIFTKIGNLSIAIAEPKPLVFNSSSKGLVSTKLPISFIFERPRTEARTDAGFSVEACHASLTWQLRNSTFASLEPMSSVPTVREVAQGQRGRLPSKVLITTLGLRHRLKLSLRGWQKTPGTFSVKNGHIPSEIWTKQDELSLSMPREALPVPTFFTPYVSRRYSLLVQITVTGIGKARFRLEVPVQIVYENQISATNRLSCQGSNSSEEGCDLGSMRQVVEDNSASALPIYVR